MSAQAARGVPAEPVLRAREAYDRAATRYDAWKWQPFWRASELPFILQALADFAPGRPRLLDVGCGTGWYLHELEPLCAHTAGIDVSEGMLAQARMRARHSELLRAGAGHLPFADGAFDVVLSTRVMSHVAQVGQAIDEIVRVLAPGGVVVLSDIDANHDYTHTRLPVADGHVMAETFKHTRGTVQAALAAVELKHRRSALILEDGKAEAIERLGDNGHRGAAGWITAWGRG
jgi:ubiquinone/menaquinone biosynthesis C-methylase UbiE